MEIKVSENLRNIYFTKVVPISNRYALICGGTTNKDFSKRYIKPYPTFDIYKVDLDMWQKKIVKEYSVLKQQRNYQAITAIRPLGLVVFIGGATDLQTQSWTNSIEIFSYIEEKVIYKGEIPLELFGPSMTYAYC